MRLKAQINIDDMLHLLYFEEEALCAYFGAEEASEVTLRELYEYLESKRKECRQLWESV